MVPHQLFVRGNVQKSRKMKFFNFSLFSRSAEKLEKYLKTNNIYIYNFLILRHTVFTKIVKYII